MSIEDVKTLYWCLHLLETYIFRLYWLYEVPCVSKVFSSSPRHDALDASSRCVLKHTARCGIPYVSKVVIRRFVTRLRALRGRRFETNGDTSNQSNGHQFQNFYNAITAWDMSNLVHEAPRASSRRLLNTWHTAPRRRFQNVHVERCITSIHPYNPFLHEAPRASSRRLLKQTARCAAPPVSKCQSWVLRRQYISIQPISPRSDGSFVTKTFEIHGTQRQAVCFKMCMLSAASPVYIHTTHLSTKRRELRHKDFWNRRHAVPRRLFQNVNLECCVANIYPYNPSLHEAPVASWRNGLYGVYWWRSAQDAHFETDGAALCAVCFKSLRDEAPVASWRNRLYGCILVTQRSRCTLWNRRRGVVCRVFQKSLWRSSRRFVEKWVVWMHIDDAALNMLILKQTARRCVPCVSKIFVTKLPSLRGEMGCMDVY